jgi:hypothetical protein
MFINLHTCPSLHFTLLHCYNFTLYALNSYPCIISVTVSYAYHVFTTKRMLLYIALHIWNIKAWQWQSQIAETYNLVITLSLFYNKSCVWQKCILSHTRTSVYPFQSFLMRTDGRLDRTTEESITTDASTRCRRCQKGAGYVCNDYRGSGLLCVWRTACSRAINKILRIVSGSLIIGQVVVAFVIHLE